MNNLPFKKQVLVIALLAEGCSIRATSRFTGVHRDTIMRLALRVGEGCRRLHDRLFQNLSLPLVQLDELWSYVGKKERRVSPEDGPGKGDQYTFVALDPISKCIVEFRTCKRTMENTCAFLADLRLRVLNRPQISSDAFPAYADAVERAFGSEVDYGQVLKSYGDSRPPVWQGAGSVGRMRTAAVAGNPDPAEISTSMVERGNLTFRMHSRRFTRRTNGFSKTLKHHAAAVSLFVAYYNFCRVHETLRMTPAMALGITDHIWTVGDLIVAAVQTDQGPAPAAQADYPGRRVAPDSPSDYTHPVHF